MKLNTGITVDIIGESIQVLGNTYHIKDTLKALGMRWAASSWTYRPSNDEDAISFLKRLHAEFPKWDRAEFGDLMELLN